MAVEIDKLIRSKRRTLSLEINDQAKLIVRAPNKASNKEINYFIEKKLKWIKKIQSRIQNQVDQTEQINFKPGDHLYYLGKRYPLTLSSNRPDILYLDDQFHLAPHYQAHAKTAFTNWYQQRAQAIIPMRAEFYAQKTGLHFQRIRISNARKRWGSCSCRGSISLNWRLIMTPINVLDSVIIHELAHLKELNHSKRFWNIVETNLPATIKPTAGLEIMNFCYTYSVDVNQGRYNEQTDIDVSNHMYML